MGNNGSHYTTQELINALREVGVKQGDVVLCHSNVPLLGYPETGRSGSDMCKAVLNAFDTVLGSRGTLVVPTFSYSYGKGKLFDVNKTPSSVGVFSEYVRRLPTALRSTDPMMSVAAKGRLAALLTNDVSNYSLGPGSFWERLCTVGGTVCNINWHASSTLLHYVESACQVPHRYNKRFRGVSRVNGTDAVTDIYYFCADPSNPAIYVDIQPFADLLHREGLAKTKLVGRGKLEAFDIMTVAQRFEQELSADPYLLTVSSGRGDTVTLVEDNFSSFDTQQLVLASAEEIIQDFHYKQCLPLSDDYDLALQLMRDKYGLSVHEYITGKPLQNGVVPEKWVCTCADIALPTGERVFETLDLSSRVLPHSKSFAGLVNQAILKENCVSDVTSLEDSRDLLALSNNDWALQLSPELQSKLQANEYQIDIETHFSRGYLRVGEKRHVGKSKALVLIVCTLRNIEAQVNLYSTILGLELFDRLDNANKGLLNYTYALLVLPENISFDDWFSLRGNEPENLIGVIELETQSLQLSIVSHAAKSAFSQTVDTLVESKLHAASSMAALGLINGSNVEGSGAWIAHKAKELCCLVEALDQVNFTSE